MSLDSTPEEKAVMALITAALHPFEKEISDEEVAEFLKSECVLSAESRAALERFGNDPLARLTPPSEAKVHEPSAEYAGMHRSLAAEEMDEETKAELERKRQEILKRIREKREREE